MMFRNDAKLAYESLKTSKWRSFMTMLGIIVGVVSVVTVVSIGEGVKHQITEQIDQLGSDLITVRSGKVVNRNSDGEITGYNALGVLTAGSLSEADWQGIQKNKEVRVTIPMNVVPGVLKTSENHTYNDGIVIGSPEGVPDALNQKLAYGGFYSNSSKDAAVIGKRIAEKLFKENIPVGKSFEFRGKNFIVRGVFDEFAESPLTPTVDYNNAVFIPYEVSKEVANGQVNIFQILLKPSEASTSAKVAKDVHSSLLASRAGQEDFTVLQQQENFKLAGSVLDLLTTMISAVAAVSLFVGGIGIMNIMLVSVSERTREIGVRKAIGATNQQILSQFMLEAAMISFVGGVIGVIVSLIVNYCFRIFTDIQPVITVPIVLLSVAVSLIVGIVFGVMPAERAARKDPIEALRNI